MVANVGIRVERVPEYIFHQLSSAHQARVRNHIDVGVGADGHCDSALQERRNNQFDGLLDVVEHLLAFSRLEHHGVVDRRQCFVVLHDHSRCVDIQGRLIHVEGYQPYLLFEFIRNDNFLLTHG